MVAATHSQAEKVKDAIALSIVAISLSINELDRWIADPFNTQDRPRVEPQIQDLTGQFHALESRLAALERDASFLSAPKTSSINDITTLSNSVGNETLASKKAAAALVLLSSSIDLGQQAYNVGRA